MARVRCSRAPLAVLVGVLAVAVPTPVRAATAASGSASATAAEPCQVDELDVSAALNPIPTAYAAGQAVTHPASIHNPLAADFTDAFFDFGLVVPAGTTNHGSAPATSWSIDGGPW
jgi:hypothetical protein